MTWVPQKWNREQWCLALDTHQWNCISNSQCLFSAQRIDSYSNLIWSIPKKQIPAVSKLRLCSLLFKSEMERWYGQLLRKEMKELWESNRSSWRATRKKQQWGQQWVIQINKKINSMCSSSASKPLSCSVLYFDLELEASLLMSVNHDSVRIMFHNMTWN